MAARVRGLEIEVGELDQSGQTSSHKINNPRDVTHNTISTANNAVSYI